MKPPRDIVEFIRRWRAKSENYNLDRVHCCFDAFFTAFVLYNFLYDYICQEDEGGYPEKGDRQRSIEVALRFLGADVIATDLELRQSAEQLRSLVMEKAFYLRNSKWDSSKVAGLASTDNEQWTECLLDILYQIRCNTFHGRKLFHEEQKRVLVPCVAALRRINDLLIEKLAPGTLPNPKGRESGGSADGRGSRQPVESG